MTEKIYIRFKDPSQSTSDEKTRNCRKAKILETILFFIPKSNPDFGKLMDEVSEWYLEIDPDDKLPTREIGINKAGGTLFVTPWRDNLGLWTDEEITLDYFKDHFKAVSIDESEFTNRWDIFTENNP